MANHALTPCGDIALLLTEAEAKGLLAFADEGASGLLPDASARLAYVGRPAGRSRQSRAGRTVTRGRRRTPRQTPWP